MVPRPRETDTFSPGGGARADLPFSQAGPGAVAQTLQNALRRLCITPQDFGAKGDGVADDLAAMQAAVSASIAGTSHASKCLYFPGQSIYRLAGNLIVTMPAHSVGPVIHGDSAYNSRLVFDAGYGFTLTSPTAMFYGEIGGFAVVCNFAGPCVQISNSTKDAANGFRFHQLVVNNSSTLPQNKAIQFNGVFNSDISITANCNGRTNGTGLEIRAGTMNAIMSSTGNCAVGTRLTSDGTNTVSGNILYRMDYEVNSIGLQIDHAYVRNNTFIGGIYTMHNIADYGIDASAGYGNRFIEPYYGGLGTLCKSSVGMIMETSTTATGTITSCTGAAYYGEVTLNSHRGHLGSAPASLSCAGGVFMPGSTDMEGRVTMTSGTSCTLTFSSPFSTGKPPHCSVTPESAPSTIRVVPTVSTIAVTFGTAQTAWSYQCQGY